MPDYRRRKVREAMSVSVDVNGAMAEVLGAAGFERAALDGLAERVAAIAASLEQQRLDGALPFLDLPSSREPLSQVKRLAADLREEADNLVVLGIGGSALAARAIAGSLPGDRRVLVADNIDPWTFTRLLLDLDLERTVFNVVSKSGDTAETMAQFLVVRDLLLHTFGAVDYQRHVVVTTDAEEGYLRQIVSDEGFRDLPLPPGIAGRFSALSAVGLLPAAFIGAHADDLLAGAAWMEERCRAADMWRNPGHALGAFLWQACAERGKSCAVFMPYCDRLTGMGGVFAQLWAECLGKRSASGNAVGQTPIRAVGATDEYAQMQLFTDGPDDKIFVLLRVANHMGEMSVPPAYTDLAGVGYLGAKTMGELLNVAEQAAEVALAGRGRMVLRLGVPTVDAFSLGQLFVLFQRAVLVAAALAGVDAFDQPGVDDVRRLEYALAGRADLAERQAEAQEWASRRRPEYVL